MTRRPEPSGDTHSKRFVPDAEKRTILMNNIFQHSKNTDHEIESLLLSLLPNY